MNTGQLQLQKNFIGFEDPKATYESIPYTSEFSGLGLRQGAVNNQYLQNQKTLTAELIMKDGIATQIGLDDTVVKKADVQVGTTDIVIKPFAVMLSDKSISKEFSTTQLAQAEMLGQLERQKDLSTLAILEARSVNKGNLPFQIEQFKADIIGAINQQGLSLGINQQNTTLMISKNIMIKLVSTNITATAVSYWDNFMESMNSMNVGVVITTLVDNRVQIMESSLIMEYKGTDVSVYSQYMDRQGSITEEMITEYVFATNDYHVKKTDANWIYAVTDLTGFKVAFNGKNVKHENKQVVTEA